MHARRLLARMAVGLVLGLVLSTGSQLRAQELTITEILNACYDPEVEALRAARWQGAPGSGLTPTTIFNQIYVPAAGGDQAYLRLIEETRGTVLPATCEANIDLFVLLTTGARCNCNATGDGWICGAGGEQAIASLFDLNDVSATPADHLQVLTWIVDGEDAYAQFTSLPETVVADGSITTAKLADGAVTAAKITNATITSAKLANTAVTPGTYGSTTQSVQVAVNAQGQITGISNQAISGIPTGSVGPSELESTAVTPGTCGSATESCIITTDQDGRITSQSEATISGGGGGGPDIVLDSLRFTPVVETTSCDMTKSVHKLSPTGTTTCTLPAATDTTKPGVYVFFVENANGVAIAPTGSNLINDANAALATVTGPLAKIRCKNKDNLTEWYCEVTRVAGYGTPLTVLCAGADGQLNDSASGFGEDQAHSLECDIPAQTLTVGSMLEVCSGWQIATGTTPPTLTIKLKADAVTLSAPAAAQALQASDTRNVTICYTTVVAEAVSTASATYTAPHGSVGTLVTGSSGAGDTAQPLDLNTNGIITLRQTSQFTTAGSGGPHTIRQLFMTVKGAGLLP